MLKKEFQLIKVINQKWVILITSYNIFLKTIYMALVIEAHLACERGIATIKKYKN